MVLSLSCSLSFPLDVDDDDSQLLYACCLPGILWYEIDANLTFISLTPPSLTSFKFRKLIPFFFLEEEEPEPYPTRGLQRTFCGFY